MVALEEVGDFLLADLGLADVTVRGGTAHLEVKKLSMALLGATERVQQLLEGRVGVKCLHFFLIIKF